METQGQYEREEARAVSGVTEVTVEKAGGGARGPPTPPTPQRSTSSRSPAPGKKGTYVEFA